MTFALQFINEGIANSASEKVANNNISGFGMSSFSDQVKYKDFDIFDSSLGRLVPSCDKSMSSLLGKKPVDGLRLTQPVWSKTENLLRSASQVLGTAEHFLAATGHLLNSEDTVVRAEVRSFLLQLDKALGSSQLLLMGSIANCTLSKRAEFLENISIAEPLKDSLLKSPLSDKMFGLPTAGSRGTQQNLLQSKLVYKLLMARGRLMLHLVLIVLLLQVVLLLLLRKGRITTAKPQNKPNNSGKSSDSFLSGRFPSQEFCPIKLRVQTDLVINCFLSLGFLISWKKSEIIPSQDFVFLGEHFLTSVGLVLPPEEKFTKLCQKIHLFLTVQSVTARQFLQLLGLLNSLADVIPLGRLHIRPLQFYLHKLWIAASQEWEALIPITQPLFPHLQWCQRHSPSVFSTPGSSSGETYCGAPQYSSRHSIQIPCSSKHGVGTTSSSFQSCDSSLGVTSDRSVCDQSQSQTSNICVSGSRSKIFAVDAMSLSWKGMFGYAFPPFRFLSPVLQKIAGENCKIIVIAPAWPKQSWFPDLLRLSCACPLVLPLRPDLLSQIKGKVLYQNPEKLHLHAWLLSGDKSSVTLLTDPAFLAKNQIPDKGAEPVVIPALPSDSISVLLCPAELLNSFNVKAHDVRGISTSWALFNSASLEEVLSAGFWRNENSFISHYLQSMATFAESLYSLGPIVSAQRLNFPPVSSVTGDSALR
ncbi:unnamed protein product [Mytilus edulis]|uniref:Uncharacterized protein n=1 Tax=Mytilus edulis TaxID=6550 RepID=A0A8S3UEL7_MYTED|nr:unnamed protein product [Mytilus edulis]